MTTPADTDHLAATTPIPSRAIDFNDCLLYVADGEPGDRGRSMRIAQPEVVIGSGDDCDLVLHHSTVSRHHAKLLVQANGLAVVDLDSTNGTFFLGQRIERVLLTTGARLTLGKCIIDVIPRGDAKALTPATEDHYEHLIGSSLAMRRVFSLLKMIENSEAPILVSGETGTGKELAARGIHKRSPRGNNKLIIIDCANVPADLVESELFGHTRGAFTGAADDRVGAFEAADRGTVFLDEIDVLPAAMQPKLLRVLETGEIKRVGASEHKRVDVRVITATNRALQQEVDEGRFREDLFYRLAVIEVKLPPLRDRREDILLTARHLARAESGAGAELPKAAEDFMMRYDWPGNVRELRNAVQRISALGLHGIPEEVPSGPVESSSVDSSDVGFREARDRVMRDFERAYLEDLMKQAEGNISKAARAAGIDRSHLRYLLKKHSLR